MSKRLFVVIALVLLVGFFTRAFAYGQEILNAPSTEPVTRAEAVALLLNADSRNLDLVRAIASRMPPMSLFKDIDQKQWYAPYMEVAFQTGLVSGTAEQLFRPNDKLTHEEAVALASRYKQLHATGSYIHIKTEQGNALNKLISEAFTNNIDMPFPVRPGQVIARADLNAMFASAGVLQPETIVIARIPVTTDFSYVAQVAPIVTQQTTDQGPLLADLLSPPPPEAQSDSTYFAISMPSIGVKDLKITHPDDLSHNGLLAPLQTGVGHLFSYPGQNGKILVYGHSSSYPWDTSEFTKIFRQINKLTVGDKVYINYHGTLYVYQVTFKQTVDAKDTSAYNQEGKEELILYTCWPPDSVKQRYLVHANLVETQ